MPKEITDQTINKAKARYWCAFVGTDPAKVKKELEALEQEKEKVSECVSEEVLLEYGNDAVMMADTRPWYRRISLAGLFKSKERIKADAAASVILDDPTIADGMTWGQWIDKLKSDAKEDFGSTSNYIWNVIKKHLGPLVSKIRSAVLKGLITTAGLYILYQAAPYLLSQVCRFGKWLFLDGKKMARCRFEAAGTKYVCEYDMKREGWVLNYDGLGKSFRKSNHYPSESEAKSFFSTEFFKRFHKQCCEYVKPFVSAAKEDGGWVDYAVVELEHGKNKDGRMVAKQLKLLKKNAESIENNMVDFRYVLAEEKESEDEQA